MDTEDNDALRDAHHEAGHAVMAHLLGLEMLFASLEPAVDGGIVGVRLAEELDPNDADSDEARAWLLAKEAGYTAEVLLHGNAIGHMDDKPRWEQFADATTRDRGVTADHLIESTLAEAMVLLSEPANRRAVKALAHILLQRVKIDEPELSGLIRALLTESTAAQG